MTCRYGYDRSNCGLGFPGCVCADEMIEAMENAQWINPVGVQPSSETTGCPRCGCGLAELVEVGSDGIGGDVRCPRCRYVYE